MQRTKGFTLIELLIVLAIIGILAVTIGNVIFARDGSSSNYQPSRIGSTHTECVGGTLFNVYSNGSKSSINDPQGRAVKCQ